MHALLGESVGSNLWYTTSRRLLSKKKISSVESSKWVKNTKQYRPRSQRATMRRGEILAGPSMRTDLEAIIIGELEIARHAVVVNETP
jgi:hypothetical protein